MIIVITVVSSLLIMNNLISQVLPSVAAKEELVEGCYSGIRPDARVVEPKRINLERGHYEDFVETHYDQNPRVHVHLPLPHNENLTLELIPNRNFIASKLVVERITNGKRKRKEFDATQMARRTRRALESNHGKSALMCHYQGYVRGHPESRAAVSLCKGMVGMVYTKRHGELWIEPLKETRPNYGGHMIFRRATTLAGTKKRRKKKRKKHEKNCGTREPKRVSETRLEWQHRSGKVKVQGRGPGKFRWGRSISKPRHVEALVVADTSVMRFHEATSDELGDVEKYLLTIMNMVSTLYQDPSIGNQISITVVEIKLLEEELSPEELNITVNADKTLESFCKWQAKENYEKSHFLHHDVAILVTRQDICARQDNPCGTLGVAHVGGMCQKERSCNVNEDNGITLAHTIAHELGHNFGMYHDTDKVGCSSKDGTTQHVMSPSFEADTVAIAWSSCSRRDITNFLEGYGDCLNDPPVPNPRYEYDMSVPPGAMYDAKNQCRLQFGNHGTSVCSPEEICSRLWCMVDDVCTSVLKPAAPGTSCGKHKWCSKQECVSMEKEPVPINGGWSAWGEWSTCSRTCGAGVAIQERFCTQPVPANGGTFCVGERRKYKICNTQPCPDNTPSYRAVQCSSYNNETFQGKQYEWVPYFDKSDPCELYCSDLDDTIIVPWGNSALDGTPCKVGSKDMCVGGMCKHVGCDWVLDSDAIEDSCGVCHGTGDQCNVISGIFDKEHGSDYEEAAVIPRKARNIFIEELGPSKNYIGISNADSGEYFLNGQLEITIAGEYQIAGSIALYERDNETERIQIPGPLEESIIVYVIFRGKFRNAGVAYNYTVAKEKHPESDGNHEWGWADWSSCSATCGFGTQIAKPVCKKMQSVNVTLNNDIIDNVESIDGNIVKEEACSGQRPDKKERVCNMQACPLPTRWAVGDWQPCPQTCVADTRSEVTRMRTVLCVKRSAHLHRPVNGIEYLHTINHQLEALPDSDCNGQKKPSETALCPDLPLCTNPTPLKPDSNLQFEPDYDFELSIDELSGSSLPKKKNDTTTTTAVTPQRRLRNGRHRKSNRNRKTKGSKRHRSNDKLNVFLKKNPVKSINSFTEIGHVQIKSPSLNHSLYNTHPAVSTLVDFKRLDHQL